MTTRTTSPMPMRPHAPARHRLLRIGACCAALTLTACATDSAGDDTDGPDVSLGTVPDGEATSESTVDTTTDDAPPTTPTDTVGGPDATTTITPSPGAELPTQAPSNSAESAPVTTAPGPLPEPSVQLVDVATFDQPLEISPKDGDPRLFVVQQGGVIIAADDESNVAVFDISTVDGATFTSEGNEQGLLGLAFHPDEDLAYVDFTNGDGDTVVAEFAVDPASLEFDPATYREVLTVGQPASNHNGGELDFGPDGYLYIALGDGGVADDPDRNGLDLSTRLGKILRIDPLPSGDAAFTVPDDNPFVGVDGADPTIWSLGLRNPWRFSFDALTDDLWIGDVGQNQVEEIDLATATDGRDAGRGVSFGWSAFEGADRFNEDQSADGHTLPVVTYRHENGNCSVSGGVVARNSSFDDLNGWYVYGDFCTGTMWALDTTSVTSTPDGPVGDPRIIEIANVPALAGVVEGPLGDIYAISNDGPVYRLAPA